MTLFRIELRTYRRIQSQICEHFEAPGDELSLLWSLQVDESSDISGKAQLLAFIRFIKNTKFVNECLFCKDMKTTTTGKTNFMLINENILLFKLQPRKFKRVSYSLHDPPRSSSLLIIAERFSVRYI